MIQGICGRCGRVICRVSSDSGQHFTLERVPRVVVMDAHDKLHLLGAAYPDLYIDHGIVCDVSKRDEARAPVTP